jgi:hypothetical protein
MTLFSLGNGNCWQGTRMLKAFRASLLYTYNIFLSSFLYFVFFIPLLPSFPHSQGRNYKTIAEWLLLSWQWTPLHFPYIIVFSKINIFFPRSRGHDGRRDTLCVWVNAVHWYLHITSAKFICRISDTTHYMLINVTSQLSRALSCTSVLLYNNVIVCYKNLFIKQYWK